MKPKKWAGIGLFAVVSLSAGGLAFANGFVKSPELLDKIRIGATTSQQVIEILGPPATVAKFTRRNVEAWDYRVQGWGRNADVSIEIDSKGIVSNVQRIGRYGP